MVRKESGIYVPESAQVQHPEPPLQFLYSFLLQIKPSSCPWGFDGRNDELDAKGFLCSLGSQERRARGAQGQLPSLPPKACLPDLLAGRCLPFTDTDLKERELLVALSKENRQVAVAPSRRCP